MPAELAAHRQWEEGWAGVRAALIEALVRAGLMVVDQELFDRLYGQPLLSRFEREDRGYPGLTGPHEVRNS